MTDIIVTDAKQLREIVRSEVAAVIRTLGQTDDVLTPEQVADVMGVSLSTVLRRLRDKSLRGKRVGNRWKILRSAVDGFLRSDGE